MDDEHASTDLIAAAAPPPPAPQRAHRRKRWDASLLRLGLMVTMLVAVGAGLVYLRVYQHRATLLRSQQECMTYHLPADAVVYEEHPARAAELLKRNDAYVPVELDNSGDAETRVPAWPGAGWSVADWVALRNWAMPPSASSYPTPADPVLFLHERRTADGDRGVVCVEADRAGRKLRVTFVHPGGVTVNPHAAAELHLAPPPQEGLVILSQGPNPLEAKLPPAESGNRADLRFFAGQPDPADATHFTLPYEWDGRRGEVEIWLQSDALAYYVDRLFAGAATTATTR